MANINATKFFPGSTATEPEKKTRAKPTIIPKRDLIVIRNRVIKIRDLVKNTTLLSEKETERKRIATEEDKFDEKEKKLEEKPDEKGEDKKSKIPGLPKLGFIDRIKNFFFKVLLGYVAVRLLPHINKLPDIVGKIGSAIDFGTDLALGLFNGLASFIDWGYKAYDATRGFLKSFGGDNVVKLFDGFGDAVNKVIDATIIAALALTELGGDDGFGGGAGKRGFDKSGRRVGKNLQERYARRFGREQFLERFGRRNLRNLSGGMRGGVRGTAKSVLGFVRPLLKRIPLPVVGALIDFGLSVALGESPGKAAFKAIGAGLAGFIGAAIGSIPVLIPFGGPLIGGFLGGMAGDALGSALYDMFFGGKKPTPQKTTKAATGGPITRGGKPVGGTVTRTIKKAKRTIKVQPTKVKPGASVGGEEKIKKIFPEVKTGDRGKKVNTLGYMKSSYDKSSSIPGFGGLFGIALKAQLGQKPSGLDYQNAAAGLNSWMQRTFSSEILRTGGAFAEGGSVDVGMFGSGENMTNMIAKSLEDNISPRMNDIFNDLQKQLMLEKGEDEKKGKEGTTTPETSGNGEYSPEGLQGEIYQYLLSKGMDDAHALGIMANISRESGFRPGVSESGGPGVGLFQYSDNDRKPKFLKAVPNYANDWKAQIDYALKEDYAPQYLRQSFSSPQEAADVWMKKWERPAEDIQNVSGPKIHADYLAGLQKYRTKKGGSGSFDFGGMDKGGVGGTLSEYITGDPNTSFGKFDRAGHGTTGNYHDHLAFKDKQTTQRAFDFFKSKGFQVTELNVSSGHTNGSLHYSGRAFDVPGAQWGGSGAIGSRDYAGSGKVRKTLKEFLGGSNVKLAKGGRVSKPTRALIGERGAEFIFDADTTRGLDSLAPNLLEYLNAAKTKSQLMGVLQSYAGYETGAEEVIEVIIPQSQMVPLPIPMPSGIGGFGGMSGGSSDSSYDSLYAGS
jgi:hypothetical protein